ncbi:hypothetical protein ACYJW8_10320 [Frateuria aurantia]
MFGRTSSGDAGRQLARLLLAALISALLVISRRPDAVFGAQFWAEDGKYWYLQAHDYSAWQPFFMQQNGYLQTVSRLIGLLAQAVPLLRAPLLFNLCAIGFQILPVLLLYTSRGRAQLPNAWLRLLLSLLYLGHPYSAEVHANVTNIQWHLVLSAAMVLVFPASSLRLVRWFDGVLLGLAALSGPFSVFLAPIAVALAWRRRDRRAMGLAAWVLGCALIQGGILCFHHGQGDRFTSALGASPELLLQLFACKVVLAGLFGYERGAMVTHWLSQSWWPGLLVSAWGAIVLLLGWLRGGVLARAVISLGTMVFAASLILPQISPVTPQWQAYLQPGAGGRYSFLPVLALYAALIVVAKHGRRGTRLLALLGLLTTLLLGLPVNWRMGAYPDYRFPAYAQRYAQAAPGQEVDIPIVPGPFWTMKLVKP